MLSGNNGTTVSIDGKNYIYFGGTNYLGLAQRAELLAAAADAFSNYGWSSGASRLTSGENKALLDLEQDLAAFAGSEAALGLPAGFMSNQAVVEGLDDKVSAWVISKKAHASILAAVRQSSKPVIALESQPELEKLANWRLRGGIASAELDRELGPGLAGDRLLDLLAAGDFSSLGIFLEPIEPLNGRLAEIDVDSWQTASSQDFLVLDEAQSFGVIGDTGRGAIEHYSIPMPMQNLIRTGTFSKAIGTYGGFVLASRQIIASIKQKSACVRGSTSLPPLLCEATRASLKLIQEDSAALVLALKANIADLNGLLLAANMSCEHNLCVPIFYLPYRSELAARMTLLSDNGIHVPSVSNYFPDTDEVGLRWTIQAGHSHEQLGKLVDIIAGTKR